jgi:hypothetical protein
VKLVTFDDGRVGELRDEIVVELDVPSMREYFERSGHVRPTGEEPAVETVREPVVGSSIFVADAEYVSGMIAAQLA